MPPRSAKIPTICLTLLFVCTNLPAQTPSYHLELSEGTSGYVILTNSSNRTIEAFHISGQCGDVGQQFTGDILQSRDATVTFELPSPGRRRSNGGVQPWAQMTLMRDFPPQPSHCTWKTNIDAVIYADGAYEGDPASARAIQANREGLASGLKYWMDRLHAPTANRAALEAISNEADLLSKGDWNQGQSPRYRELPFECEYWRSKSHVEALIATWSKPRNEEPDETYRRLRNNVSAWGHEIEANTAFKKLQTTFPLPPTLTEPQPELPKTP